MDHSLAASVAAASRKDSTAVTVAAAGPADSQREGLEHEGGEGWMAKVVLHRIAGTKA